MKITTHIQHLQVNEGAPYTRRTLSVETTPTPALCRWLRLPGQELMTGTGGVLAEPLTTGVSCLYLARLNEVAEQHGAQSLARFGATLAGVLVSTGACLLASPYVGAAALTANSVVCVLLPLLYLGSVLRNKVESRALTAAVLISRNYDAMAQASPTDAMAERYANTLREVVGEARTLSYVDERLEPACRQYAGRYNEKFGDDYVVL